MKVQIFIEPFCGTGGLLVNLILWQKQQKKKSAKEASNIFHNIMAASVKGNPKPVKKKVTKK